MEKARGKWSFIKCFSFSSFCFLFISYSCPPSTDIALTLLQTAIHIHSPIENDSPMDGGKSKELCTNRVGLKQEVSWKLRLHSHTHTKFSFHETRKDISKHYEWRLASVNADRGVLTSFDKVKWDKFQSKAEEIEKSISVKRLNSFSGFLHNRLRRQCADINSDQNTKPAQKRATFSQLRSSSPSPHRRRHLYEKSNFSHIPSE